MEAALAMVIVTSSVALGLSVWNVLEYQKEIKNLARAIDVISTDKMVLWKSVRDLHEKIFGKLSSMGAFSEDRPTLYKSLEDLRKQVDSQGIDTFRLCDRVADAWKSIRTLERFAADSCGAEVRNVGVTQDSCGPSKPETPLTFPISQLEREIMEILKQKNVHLRSTLETTQARLAVPQNLSMEIVKGLSERISQTLKETAEG